MNASLHIDRRQFLGQLSLGGLALNEMLALEARGALPPRPAHHRPRAKNVIMVFMCGGASHLETFDHKPKLKEWAGKKASEIFTADDLKGFNPEKTVEKCQILPPVFDFKQHGQCGAWVSEIYPRLATVVDEITFLKGVHTDSAIHSVGEIIWHTGHQRAGFPSMGSWVTYGLGTENQNLPGYVTLQPSDMMGGPRNHSNAFLPAVYQGSAIGRAGQPASEITLRNAFNPLLSRADQENNFKLLQKINRSQFEGKPRDDQLEAVIESFELAWRMQMNGPEVFDLSGETEATRKLYGIGEKKTDDFGKQCLIARRLAESGVRYIQVNYADASNMPRWDQHSDMPKHMIHARATDKPVAGLLADLKSRGLLEDTLVWWGGEFGRTPFSQGGNGRDHNPRGFTTWLAGGGAKPGASYGATDEIGDTAVDNKVHMHDLHATLLHMLGLDHEKLTYRYAGRDFRLTDVHGRVIHDILS